MDLGTFFDASRLVIVAGKGGVGKTTVTAALAWAASEAGRSVLVVDVGGRGEQLATLFGVKPFGYEEAVVRAGADGTGEVKARTITPDVALVEYLHDHGLRRLSNRLVRSGALDVVATAVPGLDDILVLGKVKQLERAGAADVILLDAPAAGHAITFLQSAAGLADAVKVGPIQAQAADVLELLGDPARCQVLLVTLPEETPVNELVDTAFALEDSVGVSLTPVVVNACYPDTPGLDPTVVERAKLDQDDAAALTAAAEFRLARHRLQTEQSARLAERLPLPQIVLPFVFSTAIGPGDVAHLAAHVAAGVARLPARPEPR